MLRLRVTTIILSEFHYRCAADDDDSLRDGFRRSISSLRMQNNKLYTIIFCCIIYTFRKAILGRPSKRNARRDVHFFFLTRTVKYVNRVSRADLGDKYFVL